MDRKAVAREFTAAADTQFGGAANPFREAGLVAIILDAVTIWVRQLLPVSVANALLRGVKPLLVQVCGDFAGTIWLGSGLRPDFSQSGCEPMSSSMSLHEDLEDSRLLCGIILICRDARVRRELPERWRS
jgi:hypothetical protein